MVTQGFRRLPFWLRRQMFERGVKACPLWTTISEQRWLLMTPATTYDAVRRSLLRCFNPHQVASMSDVSPISPSEGNDPPLFHILANVTMAWSTWYSSPPTKGTAPLRVYYQRLLWTEKASWMRFEISMSPAAFFTKLQKCNDSNDNYYY